MRTPDLVIGPVDNPQTKRWHLIRWRGLQVALHHWLRSDDDRALHDHSGHSISILLTGCYMDLVREPAYWRRSLLGIWYVPDRDTWHTRYPFVPYWRPATQPHRVMLFSDTVPSSDTPGWRIRPRAVWSLWIRFPPFREWGFHCPKGWRHWKDYISGDYRGGGASTTGKGCG